jgi:hypothetical protein
MDVRSPGTGLHHQPGRENEKNGIEIAPIFQAVTKVFDFVGLTLVLIGISVNRGVEGPV